MNPDFVDKMDESLCFDATNEKDVGFMFDFPIGKDASLISNTIVRLIHLLCSQLHPFGMRCCGSMPNILQSRNHRLNCTKH